MSTKPMDLRSTSSESGIYSRQNRCKSCMRRNLFLILTLLCILVGVAVGFLLNYFSAPEVAIVYIGLFGELFMRALNFSVIPLLACNIIALSAKLKPASHGKAAFLAFVYCIVLNICASFIGLGFTVLISPGSHFPILSGKIKKFTGSRKKLDLVDVFPDFLRNMVPDNILKTLLVSTVTTYVSADTADTANTTQGTANAATLQRTLDTTNAPNILGILMSSLVLGLIAGSRMEKTKPFVALAEAVTEVMSVLIEKIIKLLPIAMISLIAAAVAQMDRLDQSAYTLLLFVATAAAVNTVLAAILLPGLFALVVRRNLYRLYASFSNAVLTAFTMTSSLIALPDIFSACDRLGADPQLVRTIAPFLTSFNANGSAAFIASSVCFVAQLAGYNIGAVQYLAIGFLAGVNVMALPAVPSASLITVFLIVKVFEIPDSFISVLFVTEFIADRLRTMVNVLSHGTCIMFVHYKMAKRGDAAAGNALEEQLDENGDCYWLRTNNSTAIDVLKCGVPSQTTQEDTSVNTQREYSMDCSTSVSQSGH